jgi:hypothetical protein
MKKSLIAMAAIAALAFAGAASAQQFSGNASVQANGGLANSISVTARSTGDGNVTAFAISSGMAHGAITATSVPSSEYGATSTVTGAVDTKTTGAVGIIGSGAGVGTANMTGWSDAGTTGTVGARVTAPNGDFAAISGSGSVDAGRPTNVMHGPDVTLTANRLNTGVTAGGAAGGAFGVTVTALGGGDAAGTNRDATISDVKSALAYSSTGYSALQVGAPGAAGSVLLQPQHGSVVQLNAGADAKANVTGEFNIHLTNTVTNIIANNEK